MANNRLVIRGYDELIAQLRTLPQDLTADAQRIVDLAAVGAANDTTARYHRGPTGNLKAGVFVRLGVRGRFVAASKAMSQAWHVHLYEYGSYKQGDSPRMTKGKGRYKVPKATGVMRGNETFVPIVVRYRDQMEDRLRVMVESHGLKVTGHAG